ncbi:MAG: 30S ribosomal protein S9 [Candidatus Micrarchaeota archaeon]
MAVKVIVKRGKRKEAIARATVKPGAGRYMVNEVAVNSMTSPFIREVYLEPLYFFDDVGQFDISVNVNGGGASGQAQAARTAVARALLEAHGAASDSIKQQMLAFDRSLLVEDPRRVEPKKFKGPKARARFTKSYR